jgi:hypothetical protein
VSSTAGIGFAIDGYYWRQESLKNMPEGYVYPMFSDTWITGVAAIGYLIAEYIVGTIATKAADYFNLSKRTEPA